MYVLREAIVGIESVNRSRQQQDAGETRSQRGRNRDAKPAKAKQQRSAKSGRSHVRTRTGFGCYGTPIIRA